MAFNRISIAVCVLFFAQVFAQNTELDPELKVEKKEELLTPVFYRGYSVDMHDEIEESGLVSKARVDFKILHRFKPESTEEDFFVKAKVKFESIKHEKYQAENVECVYEGPIRQEYKMQDIGITDDESEELVVDESSYNLNLHEFKVNYVCDREGLSLKQSIVFLRDEDSLKLNFKGVDFWLLYEPEPMFVYWGGIDYLAQGRLPVQE